METQTKWFICYCKSRAEKKIYNHLQQLGLTSYLPLKTVVRQWSDRKKKVKTPMFPGYIFIQTSKKELSFICSLPNIVGPVKIGKEWGVLSQKSLDDIMQIEKSGYVIDESEVSFSGGEIVDITFGPLNGLKGMILHELGNHLLVVEINELASSVKVQIPKSYIQKNVELNSKKNE